MAPAFPLPVRLAGFYFTYYATVGAFMAYWAPYLVARGLSATQIGVIYALMGLSRATMPVLWGWLADRRGARMGMIRASSIASLLLFCMIPLVDGFWMIAVLMLAYTLFWNALLPQFEVVALNHLRVMGGDYSRVRLWGSVGFIAAVLAVGPLLDRFGMLWQPGFVAVLFALMALSAWRVPDLRAEPHSEAAPPSEPISRVLRQPAVIALLLVGLCSQLSFQPYYNFFTIYLGDHGYSRSFAGQLWALGVVAEIGIFLVSAPLMRVFGPRKLMLAALVTTSVRWLALAVGVDSLSVLLLVQLAHAISFGVYHVVAMHYVQALFPADQQGRGQAIYASVAYGMGGALGSLGAGFGWEGLSPEITFVLAGLVAGLGSWIAWRCLPREVRAAAA